MYYLYEHRSYFFLSSVHKVHVNIPLGSVHYVWDRGGRSIQILHHPNFTNPPLKVIQNFNNPPLKAWQDLGNPPLKLLHILGNPPLEDKVLMELNMHEMTFKGKLREINIFHPHIF